MKAIILAAGLGSRLKPLTEKVPKCLVEIKTGLPILKFWLDKCREIHEIDEVVINTHYLHEQVSSFINNYQSNTHLKITEFYEKHLLGSAGTIWALRNIINDNDCLIIYADNYSEILLQSFVNFYKQNTASICVSVFESENPKACGIFTVDQNENVISFVEKPKEPSSNLANAGMYLFNAEQYYKNVSGSEKDFGFEIMSKLLDKIKLYKIDGLHIDIGSIETLNLVKAKIKDKVV